MMWLKSDASGIIDYTAVFYRAGKRYAHGYSARPGESPTFLRNWVARIRIAAQDACITWKVSGKNWNPNDLTT